MAVLLVVARAAVRVPIPAAAPVSSRSCQTSMSHPKAAAAPLLLPLLVPPLLVPLLVPLQPREEIAQPSLGAFYTFYWRTSPFRPPPPPLKQRVCTLCLSRPTPMV